MVILLRDNEGYINKWNIRKEEGHILHIEAKCDLRIITSIDKRKCKKIWDDTYNSPEIRNLNLNNKKKKKKEKPIAK